MNKIIKIFMLLIFIAIVYLAIAGRELQQISTEIEIAASPEDVWSIITDIDTWHEWSPIIKASHGVAAVGSTLDIAMMAKSEHEDGPIYSPVITDMDEPGYFRWRAKMMAEFVFTNYKEFRLEATESGTRLTHTESFKGLLAPVFCDQMEQGVPPMLNAMNLALKELAER